MLSINYPKATKKLHDNYFSMVHTDKIEKRFNTFFSKPELAYFQRYDLKFILTASFEDLLRISIKLNKIINKKEATKLKSILNYDKNGPQNSTKRQPVISNFFMQNADSLELSTCYFCNIDYVNTFENIGDYKDSKEFVNKAKAWELESIKGITEQAATKILSFRKKGKITNLSLLPLTPVQKSNLSNLEVDKKYNHFTLDHILSKADHPLLALSLYNFVPSCYSCNSKFKRKQDLIVKRNENYLSPTSKDFVFDKDVTFKIYLQSTIKKNLDIKSTDDFLLDFKITKNQNEYERYIDIFKIRSRYVFHKKEILKLIKKRKNYSDSQINEIAKVTKQSREQVKQDLFGEELFKPAQAVNPLVKLRRDVAKDIGIV